MGANSGYSNTTGGYNVFVGNASGRDNTTGSFLTFMGLQSGVNNTTGNYNSFFGTYSGFNNTTGSNNTFLGYNAGLNANAGASNNVYVSSLGASGDSGTIRIGDPANQSAAYMAGINGATTNAGVPVFVDSNGKLGTAGGGSFTISGNGSANSFNSATTYQIGGGSVLSIGSAADNNVFLGLGAGSTNVAGFGTRNTFVGFQAGLNNTYGASNTFLGAYAGSMNSTGIQDTFTGHAAGINNTVGGGNSFYGFDAGVANTIGNNNTFTGNSAGSGNTSGGWNTFTGEVAGSSNTSGSLNTFTGHQTGFSNNTGYDNSFYGDSAGWSNTIGHDNTISGYQAGFFTTTGNGNVFYGAQAGYLNTTGSNDVYIANQGPSSGNESNTTRIGDPANQTAAYIAGIYGNSPAGALPVVINASGQLGTTTSGIGVTSFNGRTGAVVPAANDYNFSQIAGTLSFSQLSGTLGGSQLSGTYTNQLAFNNTSNSFAGSFAGNGSGLTGVTSGLSWPIVLESADYAIQASDFTTPTTYGNHLILTGSAAHTFNLPNPAPPSGNCVAIGNMASAPIASNLNVFLTVSANGLTVDGSAPVATQPKRNSYLYCSDGTNYWRLDRQLPGLSEIGPPLYTIDTGTVNALKTTFVSGIDFGLIAGTTMFILPINPNTSTTPTLNVNGLGAKTIVRFGNHPLALGDLSTSALAMVIYDGSNWQLINPQTIAGTVASVTATAPLVSSGGATPNISCPTCVTTAALSGTTGSIGGIALTAGICTTGTAAVTGAVVGHPVSVSASDGSLPNGLIILSAAVTSANADRQYLQRRNTVRVRHVMKCGHWRLGFCSREYLQRDRPSGLAR